MNRETRKLVITITPLLAGLLFLTVFYSYSNLLKLNKGFEGYRCAITGADPDTPDCGNAVERPAEFRARMFWGIAATALVLSLVWNSIVSIFLIRRNGLGWLSKPIVWLIVGAAVTIPIFMMLFLRWRVGGDVAETLVGSIQEYSKAITKSEQVIPINALNSASNILTIICITLIVIACCSLIYWPAQSEKNIQTLVEKIEQSKLSLYSAAGLLACGVFEVHFLFNWPASFLPDVAAVRAIANGLTISTGVLFSLLLIIVYLPIAVIHRSWISDLAHQASTKSENKSKAFDRDEWLQTHGLETSSLSVLKGMLAFLAPTIAGVIGVKLPF